MTSRSRARDTLLAEALVIGDLAGLAVMYAAAVAVALPGRFAPMAVAYSPHFFLLAGCWL